MLTVQAIQIPLRFNMYLYLLINSYSLKLILPLSPKAFNFEYRYIWLYRRNLPQECLSKVWQIPS